MLKKHSEGLIVTSACLVDNIPQLLKRFNGLQAKERIQWFLDVFGRERFYLEVQPEDQEEQKVRNKELYKLAEEMNINLVAATDCHYLTLDDHEAHEIMLSIQTGKQFDDPNRFSFGDCRAYMRTEEMLKEFPDHPEAVYNTGKIAVMCTLNSKQTNCSFQNLKFLKATDVEYFQELCRTGLEKLIENKRINPEEKLAMSNVSDIEMNLIIKMGFVGYFLIVSDFIMWARAERIPVGPGRGSAAGALVAWCLEITNIDPLKYNSTFRAILES